MKKFIPYLLLMLLMPAFFSSCKKDDKPSNTSEKWIFDKVVEELRAKSESNFKPI